MKILSDLSLDGVFYGRIELAGTVWRVGAARSWRDSLAEIQAPLTRETTEALEAAGIWLRTGEAPGRPGIMCCGLGAGWPGMGQELYKDFPVARRAMDYIATLADWDILGLMNEQDPDRINNTRWQIPYLFMLEYAQWRQFQSLGLRPEVVCGHSLGELIALCVAGVYGVDAAWQLFETRARHMAALEARAGRRGGMLAVPAPMEEIAPVLEKWPGLRISNRNTPKQFILSGRRDELLEARRHLRRRHIPAVMLSMDLAFHNPAMRILRDLSILRLNGLELGSPAAGVTMLSCVTGKPYPQRPEEISVAIADLDENTVDWQQLIENIVADYRTRVFLELGPQAVLAGIGSELAPQAIFIPADRKGHEGLAMAEACARLYALGFLDEEAIRSQIKARARSQYGLRPACAPAKNEAGTPEQLLADVSAQDRDAILALLAEACKRPVSEIRPEQDLRRDLFLRSSSFPWLLMAAEQRLGRPVLLDNLFTLSTVADLVRFLAGLGPLVTASRDSAIRADFKELRTGITRFKWLPDKPPVPAPFNPGRKGTDCSRLLLWSEDPELPLPALWLEKKDISVPEMASSLSLREYLARGMASGGVERLVLAEPADRCGRQAGASSLVEISDLFSGEILLLKRFIIAEGEDWRPAVREWFESCTRENIRMVAWLVPDIEGAGQAAADVLAWEIEKGAGERIIWSSLPETPWQPLFCPAALEGVYQDSSPDTDIDGSFFQGLCQFSLFSAPDLTGHGAGATFSPLQQQSSPCSQAAWLPLSEILLALMQCASISAPWLELAGFQDFRMDRFVGLPRGITREAKVTGRVSQELPLEGVPARVYRATMKIAAINANGRKDGDWKSICRAILLLGAKVPENLRTMVPREPQIHGILPGELLYDTLGFGREWRFLKNFRTLSWATQEQPGLEADICLPAGENLVMRLTDAALQGAFAAIGLPGASSREEVAARLLRWRFSGIGFMRFDARIFAADFDEAIIRFYPAWSSGRLVRYHIQIFCAGNRLAMAMHNLEFDCVDLDGRPAG